MAQARGDNGHTIYGFSAVNNRNTREEADGAALALCEADGEKGCAENSGEGENVCESFYQSCP